MTSRTKHHGSHRVRRRLAGGALTIETLPVRASKVAPRFNPMQAGRGLLIPSGGSRLGRLALRMVFVALLIMAGTLSLSADSFNYPNFTSITGLVLNGTAMQGKPVAPENRTVLRLTNTTLNVAGSAWYGQPVTVANGFTIQFDLNINTCINVCADGIAFVIQDSTAGTAAIGQWGCGIGYGDRPCNGVNTGGIDHSLAVEFE